jgi:hypothetical protein
MSEGKGPHNRTFPFSLPFYSAECVEGEFSEVAQALVALHTGHVDQIKAGLPLVTPSM